MNIIPCQKDCPDRTVKKVNGKTVTCHSYCEKYIEYRKQKDEENKIRTLAGDSYGYVRATIERMRPKR